ncbi:AAA family ATPase, partial [bacterium]|nr:AAA family ATPase [bacterium]
GGISRMIRLILKNSSIDHQSADGKAFQYRRALARESDYMLPALSRIDMEELRELIEKARYFILHAPRQTGKTTCLLALRDQINAEGEFRAIYANVEPAQAARGNVDVAMATIAFDLAKMLERELGNGLYEQISANPPNSRLSDLLRCASERSSKPLIVFLDEVDALVGDTLISLLRQIRAGYTDRPKRFPQTMILCGVRDVRDYRMTMADGEVITGGSAFNIKAESLRLGDFSEVQMRALYAQHTEATGQQFSQEALKLCWHLTQGQPWLVNALGEQLVFKIKPNRDRSIVMDVVHVREAAEALILRNDTHLDQLTDKLREPRVRSVIEPMLLGLDNQAGDADLQYVMDLGLIRREKSNIKPANAIYAEVLSRVLSNVAQSNLHEDRIHPSWQDASGKMHPAQFMRNFFAFWKKDGEPMMRTVSYHEAAPHLVLMAYLQRVVNGEGRIEREYAAGSGRLDLYVEHHGLGMAIEVKVWRDRRPDPIIDGLEQIDRYLTRLNLQTGFLVIFDQRTTAPEFDARIVEESALTASGKTITVWRG